MNYPNHTCEGVTAFGGLLRSLTGRVVTRGFGCVLHSSMSACWWALVLLSAVTCVAFGGLPRCLTGRVVTRGFGCVLHSSMSSRWWALAVGVMTGGLAVACVALSSLVDGDDWAPGPRPAFVSWYWWCRACVSVCGPEALVELIYSEAGLPSWARIRTLFSPTVLCIAG